MRNARVEVVVLQVGSAGPAERAERQCPPLLHGPALDMAPDGTCAWHPLTDVLESDGIFVIRMEIAGMEPERLSVQKQGRFLVVRGMREDPWRGRGVTRHQIEIPHGSFERVVALPFDLGPCAVSAAYGTTGFLEIRIDSQIARAAAGAGGGEP